MRTGDRVKVINLKRDKETNLWGNYEDVTLFLNQPGIITNHYDEGQRCEAFGIEFDNMLAQITRERTGLIFSKDQLELLQ